MGWDEVKKINSDMMVPLDERATYISGIIPRKSIERTIYGERFDQGEYSEVIIDIIGSGYISKMDFSADATTLHYGGAYALSKFEIEADGKNYVIGARAKVDSKYIYSVYSDFYANASVGIISEEFVEPTDQIGSVSKKFNTELLRFYSYLKVTRFLSSSYYGADKAKVSSSITYSVFV